MTKQILLNGQPKAGNHVLTQIPLLLGYEYPRDIRKMDQFKGLQEEEKEFQFWLGHVKYGTVWESIINAKSMKMIFIIRDPRDVLASLVRAVSSGRKHKEYFKDLSSLGAEEFINRAIKGIAPFNSTKMGTAIPQYRDIYLPWIGKPYCLTVKFEDLIGQRGGGNNLKQEEEFLRICKFIGYEHTIPSGIAEGLYSEDSNTFIPGGKIGAWKSVLTKANLDLLDEKTNNLVQELGYV